MVKLKDLNWRSQNSVCKWWRLYTGMRVPHTLQLTLLWRNKPHAYWFIVSLEARTESRLQNILLVGEYGLLGGLLFPEGLLSAGVSVMPTCT
jgi:hypothetical protein